jgi:UDP-N-acetylmuramate--alanine ligase
LAIILNIEFDHADYFKNITHVSETFLKFAGLVPEDGYLVVCADDPRAMGVMDCVHCNKVTFGLKPGSTYSASNITFDDMGCATYTLMYRNEEAAVIRLNVPGIHNVSNSLAAIAACSIMGCKPEIMKKALEKFTGTHRRFELKGISENIKVIDDYAHHPSEVAATLKAARNCSHSHIWCVFQPHTYTRTKYLMDEFAVAFADAGTVILADIYAAREKDNGEVNSGMLAERINENGNKALYIKSFDDIVEFLDKNAKPGDLIITMGAGDIYKVGEKFLEERKHLAVS